jgi:hypothetical protein
MAIRLTKRKNDKYFLHDVKNNYIFVALIIHKPKKIYYEKIVSVSKLF